MGKVYFDYSELPAGCVPKGSKSVKTESISLSEEGLQNFLKALAESSDNSSALSKCVYDIKASKK